MIASAGLIVQHVEAVHDTWQLVVVSPTNRVLPRIVGLASRPPAAPPEPPPSVPTFQASTLSSATQSRTAPVKSKANHLSGKRAVAGGMIFLKLLNDAGFSF